MTTKLLTILVVLLYLRSSDAVYFRDLAKNIMVGSILGTPYFNETHVQSLTGKMFNLVTPENEMKWVINEPVQGKVTYERADAIVEYAQKNKMKVRAHNLIWHKQIPDWLNKLNKTELHKAMLDRIKASVTHFKGKVYAWDVVNEVVSSDGGLRKSIWSDNFGETFIAEAFHLARKLDPAAKLYINEYSIETNRTKAIALYKLVKKLKSQGVPIDGVGIQSHMTSGEVPKDYEKVMGWFISLGVEVAVTEMELYISSPSKAQLEQQAKDFARVYKACESFKECVGVSTWCTSDKFCWKKDKDPCLFDANFNPKPAVAAVAAILK